MAAGARVPGGTAEDGEGIALKFRASETSNAPAGRAGIAAHYVEAAGVSASEGRANASAGRTSTLRSQQRVHRRPQTRSGEKCGLVAAVPARREQRRTTGMMRAAIARGERRFGRRVHDVGGDRQAGAAQPERQPLGLPAWWRGFRSRGEAQPAEPLVVGVPAQGVERRHRNPHRTGAARRTHAHPGGAPSHRFRAAVRGWRRRFRGRGGGGSSARR